MRDMTCFQTNKKSSVLPLPYRTCCACWRKGMMVEFARFVLDFAAFSRMSVSYRALLHIILQSCVRRVDPAPSPMRRQVDTMGLHGAG